MDIHTMVKEAKKKKKYFISIPRDHAELILFDFEKPFKRKKFQGTEYVCYECQFKKINGKVVAPGNHLIQLSFKTAWYQLYNYLQDEGKIKEKNIHLFINKKDNYHYIYSIKEGNS